jgi:hypothetical protein
MYTGFLVHSPEEAQLAQPVLSLSVAQVSGQLASMNAGFFVHSPI